LVIRVSLEEMETAFWETLHISDDDKAILSSVVSMISSDEE